MNRYFRIIITFLFVVAFLTSKVTAQSLESDAVTVRPAIINALPNQSYDLTIKNNSDELKLYKAIPSAFSVVPNERRVIPVYETGINFSDYLVIEPTEFELNPKQTKVIKAQFIKSEPNYILGVTFAESTISSKEIGTTMQLASLFLDRSITDEDLLKIKSDLEVKPKFSLGSISLGKNYNISSKVVNESKLFLEGGGEVRVLSENSRLESLSLTQNFPPNIYPTETIFLETKFEDRRNILDRIGLIKFEQKIFVNDKEIVVQKQVLSLPFELITLFIILILIVILIFTIYKNINSQKVLKPRVRHLKRNVPRRKTTIDLGKQFQNPS